VGIGAYVDDRFGPEVTDRLLEPLLGGVYAGRARDLSFAAVSPRLFELARGGGSLLELARLMTPTGASGPVFAGLEGGVSTLVDALVDDLAERGVVVRTQVAVREITAAAPDAGGTGGSGYRLRCGPVPSPAQLDVDAVVLATPAAATARLLARFVGERLAAELGAIPYASMAVITLVVRGAALVGSGLLVPPGELPTIKAVTYSSEKWAWVGTQAERTWGRGAAVVRASVGRVGESALLQVDDPTLLSRTFEELRTLPGWERAELVTGQVRRWGGALPQYLVGHLDLVERLRSALARWPGLQICGAALDGVGIAACVGTGTAAAGALLANDQHT